MENNIHDILGWTEQTLVTLHEIVQILVIFILNLGAPMVITVLTTQMQTMYPKALDLDRWSFQFINQNLEWFTRVHLLFSSYGELEWDQSVLSMIGAVIQLFPIVCAGIELWSLHTHLPFCIWNHAEFFVVHQTIVFGYILILMIDLFVAYKTHY